MSDAREQRKLEQDDLVEMLSPDPAQRGPQGLIGTGWLGRSIEDGYWRLYPSPELDEYIEVAESDIVMRRPLDPAISPLGGSVVVIKSTADLYSMARTPMNARAALLEGELASEFAAAPRTTARVSNQGSLGNKDYTKGFLCGVSMFFACATHVVNNPVCTLASGKLCRTQRYV